MARSAGAPNLTSAALAATCPVTRCRCATRSPFTSALRWSALQTDGATWVLGAPEALAPSAGPDLDGRVRRGPRRACAFSCSPGPTIPVSAARRRRPAGLPALEPLAVVALADELRPDVPDTLARFADEGIALKVLSGDDPDTVAALAGRAGLRGDAPVHAGTLRRLSDAELDAVVAAARSSAGSPRSRRNGSCSRCAGRAATWPWSATASTTPARSRRRRSAWRCAAAAPSPATSPTSCSSTTRWPRCSRPAAQGRRIINGIATSTQVFLARVATQGLVIVAVTMLGLGFPYSPAQGGLTLFTVGVPTLFLTAWARPDPPIRTCWPRSGGSSSPRRCSPPGAASPCTRRSTRGCRRRSPTTTCRRSSSPSSSATPAWPSGDPGFTDAAATIGAQTGLSTFVSLASILLILFLAPPTRLFSAWTRPTGDKRPAILVAALLAVLVGALFTPAVSDYFGLTGAAPPVYTTVLPVLAVWFVVLGAAYRFRVLDHLLGLRHLPTTRRA